MKHILPLGDTQRPPLGLKIFQTQNVPDIIPMILKEKNKEIRPEKHEGNTFYPWVILQDPLGEAQMKIFQTQTVPDIIPMILKEKI